jgi:hypothetical protein
MENGKGDQDQTVIRDGQSREDPHHGRKQPLKGARIWAHPPVAWRSSSSKLV